MPTQGPPGPRPAFADDLAAARREAFALLARGVADRRSPFHTPTLATVGADGGPRARTVVLRGFAAEERCLRLHTDARSAKVAELARESRAELHLYDAARQVQLRLRGRATLHQTDAVADAAWAASRPFSRQIYSAQPAPGLPVPAPPPAPRDPEAGRADFAVVQLRFDRLEWLWLCAAGHRRALFTWEPEAMTWLAP
ncbi:pyridoxamine 5'-phosphate oxidase family protein [Roseococcus sp. DSY-14]|uniref:pyridoxamine 5'-phosphate oxidase family protein n=1 Tax=Roseococcus sp. DSY-14 TaxID=3369650 RepID=UPI00387B3BA0